MARAAGQTHENTPKGLFVYGTLHPDHTPDEIRASVAQLSLIGSGTVTGELLDLGEYPGLITNGARNTVPGTLFALPDAPEVLRALDAYEGFNPDDVDGSLFRREPITVTMDGGHEETHWIYLYSLRDSE